MQQAIGSKWKSSTLKINGTFKVLKFQSMKSSLRSSQSSELQRPSLRPISNLLQQLILARVVKRKQMLILRLISTLSLRKTPLSLT